MPPPKKQHVADPYANMPEPPEPQDPYANMPDAFAAPADSKNSFRMHTPEGVEVSVDYDRVMDAYKNGYTIHPDDRIKYGDAKVSELKGKGKKGKFNPDTDLPEAFNVVKASPPTGSLDWIKQKAQNIREAEINLLPTIGGALGGIVATGLGLEAGPLDAYVIAPAGAAAGGGLGEDLRQSINEFDHPYDHRMTAMEAAGHIAGQAAVQGGSELFGRGVSRGLGPVAKYYGETATEADKAGFRMLPSEARGTHPNVFETYPKGSIFTAGSMAKWRVAQNQETEQAARDLADTISNKALSKTGSREEAGEVIRKGIEKHMKKFRAIQNAMYNRINKLTSGVNSSRTDMVAFAKQELQRLNTAQKAGGATQMTPFRQRLQSIVDNKLPTAPFNAMKDLRSALLAEARDDNELLSGPEKGFLKKMAGIIDNSMEDSLKKSGVKGLPELWRSANSITREEHEMFEKKLIENLAAKKNPEDIALVLRGNSPGAISQIGIQETRDAMSVIPKAMIPRVQKQILLDTIYEATGKGTKSFDEGMFAKKILQIGDERGNVLFGSNWKNVKQFSELLNRIQDSGGLQAASLRNPEVAKQVGRIAFETVFTGGGAYMGHASVGAAALIPLAGEAALWKTAAAAMTHPAGAEKIINLMRILARATPYAGGGAYYVHKEAHRDKTKPSNEIEEMKKKVQDLNDQMYKSGLSPKPPDATPPAPGPQSQFKITHKFNPETGQIEAA